MDFLRFTCSGEEEVLVFFGVGFGELEVLVLSAGVLVTSVSPVCRYGV